MTKSTLRRTVLLAFALTLGQTGCAPARTWATAISDVPLVVVKKLGQGSRTKYDVRGETLEGQYLFGSAGLNEKNGSTAGWGVKPIPEAVRVRWRAAPAEGRHWTSGPEEGDYTVDVRRRIPRDVIDYVRAKRGRALVLRFRLKDDGVLLAWDVQESGQYGLLYAMHGGDFKDPEIDNGKVVDPGWEKPRRD